MVEVSGAVFTKVSEVLTVYSVKGDHLRRTNRECYGLSLCRSGRIVYRHDGRDFVSDSSSAILLPKGATYELYRQETGTFPLVNFWADGLSVEEFAVIPLERPDDCFSAYEALFQAYTAGESHFRIMRCLYELFDLVFFHTAAEASNLWAAEQYLHQHLYDPTLRNADLARAANVSEVYFRKLFTQRHGVPPHRYILSERIRSAKHRLAGSRDSIGEIALMCGFSDIFHFCRAFRDSVGCTPGEYRKRSSLI